MPSQLRDQRLLSLESAPTQLRGETVPDSLPATPKSPPTRRVPPRGTPSVPAPLPLSPLSPPDRDRRGDSPAWRQASLSITNSQSSLRLTSIESVMPSSNLILCCPLLLCPPVPPSIRVFSNESALRMRWPKYWSFSFSINIQKTKIMASGPITSWEIRSFWKSAHKHFSK